MVDFAEKCFNITNEISNIPWAYALSVGANLAVYIAYVRFGLFRAIQSWHGGSHRVSQKAKEKDYHPKVKRSLIFIWSVTE